jgi:hypothetical protein
MDEKMKIIPFIMIILLMTTPVFASEELVLPFSKFTIQSDGMDESGVIVVEGQKDTRGKYQKLRVKAFGKTIKITKELLDKIPASNCQNGIQLSYESGYKIFGGRTIYIMFLSGSTSGIDETFIIEVTENGEQSILKNP